LPQTSLEERSTVHCSLRERIPGQAPVRPPNVPSQNEISVSGVGYLCTQTRLADRFCAPLRTAAHVSHPHSVHVCCKGNSGGPEWYGPSRRCSRSDVLRILSVLRAIPGLFITGGRRENLVPISITSVPCSTTHSPANHSLATVSIPGAKNSHWRAKWRSPKLGCNFHSTC
jgi:hypothetical protein